MEALSQANNKGDTILTNFNSRYCVYGSSNQSIYMKDKYFLHSFLRKEDAMSYIKEHSNRHGEHECYDIYVGENIIERVYVKSKETTL